MAFFRGAARTARILSVAHPQDAHALIAGQKLADLDQNIFHFNKTLAFCLAPHETSFLEKAVEPHVLDIASRTVRVAATFAQNGRVVPEATTCGSGLLLGDYVITAAHTLECRKATHGPHLKPYRMYVSGGVECRIPNTLRLMTWASADEDYLFTSELNAISSAVETLDVDGSIWRHNADTAVLRVPTEQAAQLRAHALPPRRPIADWFAAPEDARLGMDEVHYVLGFPGVPSQEDEAAALWHGNQPITSEELRAVVGNYETLILSRGTSLRGMKTGTPPASPLPEAGQGAAVSGLEVALLQPHCANALGGMSGGPVLNSAGRIVGMHVGGRESTGEYNMYVGVDHPVMRAVVRMILEREPESRLA